MSLARRSLQVVAFVCTLIVGVTSMAVIVTQTTWFKEWLRGFIVRQSKDYLNGELRIGHLGGNLFYGVHLEDVDIAMNGKMVVDVKNIALDYNAFTFINGGVVLDSIALERPVLRLDQGADGTWNLMQLVKARTPDKPDSNRTLEIGEIGIADGTLYVDESAAGTSGVEIPSRIARLDASIGVKSNATEIAVDINHISLRAAEPQLGINSVKGVIRKSDTEIDFQDVQIRTEQTMLDINGTVKNLDGKTPVISLKASSDKFSLNELSTILPALRGYNLEPRFRVTADGPADKLAVDLNAEEKSVGKVDANATLDVMAPTRRFTGNASVENLDIGPLVRRTTDAREVASPQSGRDAQLVVRRVGPSGPPATPIQSKITGDAQFDITLGPDNEPKGTYAVKAPHVQVAGYEARNVVASGRVDGSTIAVDGKANAYGGSATASGTIKTGETLALDLKGRAGNLDLRNLPPQLNAPGVPSNLQFAYTLTGRGPQFSGTALMEQSTLAGATIENGTRAEFSVGDGAPSYGADGRVANLDLQQIGKGFDIPTLADDRFRSRVNASFTVKGSGGGRYPLTLDATGTLVDSELFGATFPQFDFTTNLANGDAHVKAKGQFANLDPGKASGNGKLEGEVSGSVDIDTTIRQYASGVTPESIQAAGRVDLTASNVGGIRIDSAAIDGNFANRSGTINTLTVNGPDLTVTGQGPIALDETGASNLALHVEAPSLETIGAVVNQPLTGAAIVDAWLTGNGSQLFVNGTVIGSNVGQGDNTILSVTSNVDATIPHLDMQQASVHASTTGNFLQVGGQRVNYITADTTYGQSQLEFTATAQQQQRELTANGTALLHPDHQEIHLPQLALRTQNVEWRTAPGTEATIQYGGERITVENVQLVSGDQRIAANGSFGAPGESLKVQAENVDVSQLNQLALGEPGKVQGRLTANATISGTKDAPRAEGEFTLNQGAFQMFRFDSLGGKVDYTTRGVNLDVKLQQNATQWLTAKGFAPVTLFTSNPAGTEGHQATGGGEPIDIQVESSPIDLGIIQGLTTHVTNVTGTMQANLKVTGSGYDPHLDGAIDVHNGSLQIPELGTMYSGIDTRVELTPEAIKVGEMRIVDNHGNAATIGGQLAVHERTVGGVDVSVKSDNFKVIDNKLGNIRINSDLHLTGEIRYPRLEGSLGIETGQIDVAQLLQQFAGDQAYSTEATPLPAGDSGAGTRKVIANADIPGDAEAKNAGGGADTAPNTTAVTRGQEGRGEAPAPAPAQGSVFENLAMDVQFTVPDDLVLKGRDITAGTGGTSLGDMTVTVGGSVYIGKAPGDVMRLTGDVRTIRGFYTFQGRRFEIMRDGRIRFIGSDEINPSLDIEARRVIQSVEAFVRVRGTMTQPELSFHSNPPLEEADILSLIIFNQPINQLGEGQQASLTQRATDLATGYVASGLARSIGTALNLNEFEIQAQGENGEGPSVTIGQQVGKNLYFRLQQGFGSVQATQFILEYQLADFLRLQATAAETSGGSQRIQFRRVERGGLDLIFFFSY